MRRTLRTSLAVGSFVASALAQKTHLVGPGGFAQIRDALAVAAPGDIVNVQPGTYAHFAASVGVTIRAVTIGTVRIEYDPTFGGGGPTSIAPPAGQVVHCIGLDFRPNWGFGYAHRVDVVSGTATFDRCTLRGQNSWHALSVTGARVHLQACSLFGVGTGGQVNALSVDNAAVTAVRCHFEGNGSPSISGVGVRLRSSQFQGSQLQLVGGSFFVAALALDLERSSAWISDSTITTAGTACPVRVLGGSTCQLDRCVLSSTTCVGLSSGLVVGTDSTTPLQNGAPFTVDYRTTPHQVVAVFASPGLGYVPLTGITDQPVTIDVLNHWLATVLVADATGFATVTWNIPPGFYVDASVFVIGAGLTPTTFALSPPVGGVIR